ncbi:MAG: 4'-phosphopantetheinyl transferase superfamily protein [Lachnospiraceae bacterium]|nr:4'-phosphopantetheinyl transferase superfamily protein [Lachnospiraceae bacterium]
MKLYIRTIDDYENADESLLEAKRRGRLARIKNARTRLECVAAGMLLREALSGCGYPVADEPLTVFYDDNGKPYVEHSPYFSLSHSGGLVICAVDDEPIGADVQVVKGVTARLAKKVLSENELAEFVRIAETKSEQEAERYFTICWTEKESVAKLIGKGIGMDFRTIDRDDYRMQTLFRTIGEAEYVISVARKA